MTNIILSVILLTCIVQLLIKWKPCFCICWVMAVHPCLFTKKSLHACVDVMCTSLNWNISPNTTKQPQECYEVPHLIHMWLLMFWAIIIDKRCDSLELVEDCCCVTVTSHVVLCVQCFADCLTVVSNFGSDQWERRAITSHSNDVS